MMDFSKINALGNNSIKFKYLQKSFTPAFLKISSSDLYWEYDDINSWLSQRGEFDIRSLPINSVIDFFIPAFFDFIHASLTYKSQENDFPENVNRHYAEQYRSVEVIFIKLMGLYNNMIFSYSHYLSFNDLANEPKNKSIVIQKIKYVYTEFEKSYFKICIQKRLIFLSDNDIYNKINQLIFKFKHKLIKDMEDFAINSFKTSISTIKNYQPFSTYEEPFRFFELLVSGHFKDHDYFEYILDEISFNLEIDNQIYQSLYLVFTGSLDHDKLKGYFKKIDSLTILITPGELPDSVHLVDSLKYVIKVLKLYFVLLPKKIYPEEIIKLKDQYQYLSSLIDVPVSVEQKSVIVVEKGFLLFEKKIQLFKFLLGKELNWEENQFNLFNKGNEAHYFVYAILKYGSIFKNTSGKDIQDSRLFNFDGKPFNAVNYRQQIKRLNEGEVKKANTIYNGLLLEKVRSK